MDTIAKAELEPGPLEKGSRQFERAVFCQELNQIRIRQAANLCAEEIQDIKPGPPSSTHNLVGLAFSGGGIRSATFNLGILQALSKIRRPADVTGGRKRSCLLHYFDYLSTVSGGGYIGSWLAAWMLNEGAQGPENVPENLRGVRARTASSGLDVLEAKQIRHLREYSNYLTPRLGAFSADTWTAVSTYFRNFLLNQLVIIPTLVAVLLVPWLILSLHRATASEPAILIVPATVALVLLSTIATYYGIECRGDRFDKFTLKSLQWAICVPLVLGGILLMWIPADSAPAWAPIGGMFWGLTFMGINGIAWLTYTCYARFSPLGLAKGERRVLVIDAMTALLFGFIAGCALQLALGLAKNSQLDVVHLMVFGPPVSLVILLLGMSLQIALRVRMEHDMKREWWARLGGWLLIYAVAWLGIFGISLYGPWVVGLLHGWTMTKGSLIVGWIVSTVGGLIAARSPDTGKVGGGGWKDYAAKLLPPIAVVGLLVLIAAGITRVLDHWSTVSLPLTTNAPVPVQFVDRMDAGNVRIELNVQQGDMLQEATSLWTPYSERVRGYEGSLLALLFMFCLALAAIMAPFIDVNEFSLHAFYRNRLVRAYLRPSRKVSRPNPITNFDQDDDIPLAWLDGQAHKIPNGPATLGPYRGPYVLINTALNLTEASRLGWQERKAASFVLTPRFCGTNLTQYAPTREYLKQTTEGVNLGTALAISGAAFTSSMGYHSSRPIAFFLSLFNIRLGWWVGNPANPEKRGKTGPSIGHFYLLRELFGKTDNDSHYLYLSDGGHFDNLGLYELVRRRCRYIVCCDAAADPGLHFGDLGSTIRKIRIDLGVEIDMNLDMLLRKDGRYSQWHHAFGVIRYDKIDPQSPAGLLVLIKASLTKNEPADVYEYSISHPAFPHETTLDQFFSESQFESYRRLGEHIGLEVFGAAEQSMGKGADEFFYALRSEWITVPPSIADSFLAETQLYVKLEEHLRRDPGLARYDVEIYPELVGVLGHVETAPTSEDPRSILHFVNLQIQLMENVFYAVKLAEYHAHPLNRGWMNLFRRWSSRPTFRQLWPALQGIYSKAFAEFGEYHLNLSSAAIPSPTHRRCGADETASIWKELKQEWPYEEYQAYYEPFERLPSKVITIPSSNGGLPSQDWAIAALANGGDAGQVRLMIWVRGAYRRCGLGGVLLKHILELENKNGKATYVAMLPLPVRGKPGYAEEVEGWIRFYGRHGFVRDSTRRDCLYLVRHPRSTYDPGPAPHTNAHITT